MILVDTSVIADIFTKDPNWFKWSSDQIERWGDQGPLCYNAITFAELSVKFDTQKHRPQCGRSVRAGFAISQPRIPPLPRSERGRGLG